MAVTINIQPTEELNSSYRFAKYKVTSDAGTVVRMKAEIFVDGSSINLSKEVILDPDKGTSNVFTFELQDILYNYTTFDIPIIAGGFEKSTASWRLISVKFTEVLDNGTAFVDGANNTSNSKLFGNITWQHDQFILSTFLTKYYTSLIDWMTFAPDSKVIQPLENESMRLHMLTGGGNRFLEIKTFDKNGNLQQTARTTDQALDNHPYDIGVGPANINVYILASGSQDVIDSNVFKYTVQIFKDSTEAAVSELKTFILDRQTYRNQTRFHWQNRNGAFDSYTYTARHTEGLEVSETEFKQVLLNNAITTSRGRKQIKIDAFEKRRAWTTALSDADIRWLEELYTSSLVYIEDPVQNAKFPIMITNKSDWFFDDSQEEAPQLPLEYIFSNQLILQRN